MYFKWGTKEKKVVETTIDGALCPHCAAYQFTIISWITYFFIYWIPFFIKNRKIDISCSACKKNIHTETIPEDFYNRIKSLAFPVHKIAVYYSGIPLIIIILYISIHLFTNDKNTQRTYIENPEINDVYLIEYNKIVTISPNKFGYLRLKTIEPKRLGFNISKQSFDDYYITIKDLHNWNAYQDHYYHDEIKYYSKQQLIGLEKNGVIQRIYRPTD